MSKLKKYNDKRNFNKTSEPVGVSKKSNKKRLKFVIQHHFSRKEHYDLRLEWNGVYVSFAVPKGISYNPKDKRLAIKVEDHPISYGNFEGIIPPKEYGAGVVMLWDKGYVYYEKNPNFNSDVIKFRLKGKRMNGSWTLVNIKDNNYLVIKEKDEFAKRVSGINKFKTSIKSGKTYEEIKEDKIVITNKDKVIIDKNITKEDIFNYYKKVSKRMFEFLDNRLISVVMSPSGIDDGKFFVKHLNTKSKNIGKKKVNNDYYYYIKNELGLLEEVQMNHYEFHIWNSMQNDINKPDLLVFDFDPDESLSLSKVRSSVKDLKKILDKLKLKSYLKTSGGKGYHVFIPLKTESFKKTEEIAKMISQLLMKNNPNKYTTNMRLEKRKNKVFIDYFRNKKGSTSVCPYSIRLRSKAPISCPISWKDLDKIKPNEITIKNIDNFLSKKDPWANFFK